MSEPPERLAVGRVTRAHGVHGEVAVLPLSEVEGRFSPDATVWVGERGDRSLVVRAVRPHRGRLLVTFERVLDRDAAEALAGEYLFVPATAAPELAEGSYWPHELIGCAVVTDDGRELGAVREIVHTPANDVWIAAGDAGETLVPALRDVVHSVDVEGRRIVVATVPGLTVP